MDVRKIFIYLNRLRESGQTNMFGAAPYLMREFGLNKRDARHMLARWMAWVEEDATNLEV